MNKLTIHGDLYTVYQYLIILVAACLLGAGCASSSPEEAAYRRSIDRENYQLCQAVYLSSKQVMIHLDHLHGSAGVRGLTEREAIRSDLSINDCRQVLGPYWADY